MDNTNEAFDLQAYTNGVERIVEEALRATLKNPRESAFMLKFAAASKAACLPERADFCERGRAFRCQTAGDPEPGAGDLYGRRGLRGPSG